MTRQVAFDQRAVLLVHDRFHGAAAVGSIHGRRHTDATGRTGGAGAAGGQVPEDTAGLVPERGDPQHRPPRRLAEQNTHRCAIFTILLFCFLDVSASKDKHKFQILRTITGKLQRTFLLFSLSFQNFLLPLQARVGRTRSGRRSVYAPNLRNENLRNFQARLITVVGQCSFHV